MVAGEELLKPSGFKVEVMNPSGIYHFVTSSSNFASEETPVHEELSTTEHLSDLIDRESTSVGIERVEEGQGSQYLIQGILSTSPKINSSVTFFSEQEIKRIREFLLRQGYETMVRDIPDQYSINVFGLGGYGLQLDLGYKSQEHMSKSWGGAARSGSDLLRRLAFRVATRGTDSGFRNISPYGVSLYKEKGDQKLTAAPLEDETEFVKGVGAFAKGYELSIRALHEAKGLALPEKSIIIKPPVQLNTTLKLS